MNYIGDFLKGQDIDVKFGTFNAAGASVNRNVAGTVRVYKNDSTTEDASSDVTDTAAHDSVTGITHLRIAASADPTFYEHGNDFFVVVHQATIDGQVVSFVVAHFSIENRSDTKRLTEPAAIFSWTNGLRPRDLEAFIAAMIRNKMTQTGSLTALRNDADSATIASWATSDDGTTLVSAEAS